MDIQPATLSEFLRQDFAQRRIANPRFSLRAYAKLLSISPSHLSLIFSKRRKVNAASALRIAESLGLTPTEALQLFRRECGQAEAPVTSRVHYLSGEEFSVISEWYYYGILGLAALRPNVARAAWIAERLGIPFAAAEAAFGNLLAHKYVEIVDGQFRRCSAPVQTPHDAPSAKVRRYHKQTLALAAERIDQVDVEAREYVSVTVPLGPRQIKAAKAMIRRFKEEFADELARGKKSEVYNLSIQFFPITVQEKKGCK